MSPVSNFHTFLYVRMSRLRWNQDFEGLENPVEARRPTHPTRRHDPRDIFSNLH